MNAIQNGYHILLHTPCPNCSQVVWSRWRWLNPKEIKAMCANCGLIVLLEVEFGEDYA